MRDLIPYNGEFVLTTLQVLMNWRSYHGELGVFGLVMWYTHW